MVVYLVCGWLAGFMVMNHDTYPNLLQFFADLGVPLEPTDMSFCVTDAQDRTWTFGWNPIAWLTMLPTPRFWHWVRFLLPTNQKCPFLLTIKLYFSLASSISCARSLPLLSLFSHFEDFRGFILCSLHGIRRDIFISSSLVHFFEPFLSSPCLH